MISETINDLIFICRWKYMEDFCSVFFFARNEAHPTFPSWFLLSSLLCSLLGCLYLLFGFPLCVYELYVYIIFASIVSSSSISSKKRRGAIHRVEITMNSWYCSGATYVRMVSMWFIVRFPFIHILLGWNSFAYRLHENSMFDLNRL